VHFELSDEICEWVYNRVSVANIKATSKRRRRTKNFANVDHTQMCSDVFN